MVNDEEIDALIQDADIHVRSPLDGRFLLLGFLLLVISLVAEIFVGDPTVKIAGIFGLGVSLFAMTRKKYH